MRSAEERNEMNDRRSERKKRGGFTLMEVVVGIALFAVAVLGLAQMFMLAVMNNMRSDRITSATFLAQQQIEVLRNLTQDEFVQFAGSNGIDLNGDGADDLLKDEFLNSNNDNVADYRRITDIQTNGAAGAAAWEIRVLVVSAEEFDTDRDELLQNPRAHQVRALVDTLINR
jgi:prepilin-type N-terminal cleavage/methylation domain-containing protein